MITDKFRNVLCSIKPNVATDDSGNIWFEWFLDIGRFGVVYNNEDPKSSSWFLVGKDLESSSGYLNDAEVFFLTKVVRKVRRNADIEKTLNYFVDELLYGMKDLDPKYAKIVSEHFWELV